MRATIKQIAERSGVSVPTVSRILSDKGEAHQQATRDRVLKVAQEMGYRPNSSARAMRRGRFDSIAILQSADDSGNSLLPAELLTGIQQGAAARELKVMVAALPDAVLVDATFVPKILREWSVDGLLINYNARIPDEMTHLIAEYRIPAVWINSIHQGDCIYPDDERGAWEATNHLLSLGHERVAYVDFHRGSHYSCAARRAGYEAAMSAARKQSRTIHDLPGGGFPHDMRVKDLYASPVSWLKESDRPTAVVCYTTQTTQLVLLLAASYGLRVPQDLSVVGFATSHEEVFGFPVDTMIIPQREIGQQAVEMLVTKIENPDLVLPPRPVALTSYRGATTAPPR